jgi:hypothetical protein
VWLVGDQVAEVKNGRQVEHAPRETIESEGSPAEAPRS